MGVWKPDKGRGELASYKGKMWHHIHTISKPIIRKFAHFVATRYFKDIIEKKEKTGWVNPEIKLLYDEINELMEREREGGLWDDKRWTGNIKLPNTNAKTTDIKKIFKVCSEKEAKGKHPNEMFFEDFRNILCGILDEDSYYTVRFFYMVEMIFRDYEKYHIAMHRKRAYWNWEAIMKQFQTRDLEKNIKEDGFVVFKKKA